MTSGARKRRVVIRVDDTQPKQVCRSCGLTYGTGINRVAGIASSVSPGECGVCGNHTSVTEPRDFGYLRRGWQQHEKATP